MLPARVLRAAERAQTASTASTVKAAEPVACASPSRRSPPSPATNKVSPATKRERRSSHERRDHTPQHFASARHSNIIALPPNAPLLASGTYRHTRALCSGHTPDRGRAQAACGGSEATRPGDVGERGAGPRDRDGALLPARGRARAACLR